MRVRRFTTRRELEEHHFPWLVLIGVPLVTLLIAAYLPKLVPASALIDLPLLVVIFFSLSQRSAIGGTFMGAFVGLLQDTLSNQYIGVNGVAKTLVGFAASSVGLKVDVENSLTRALLVFGLSMAQSAMLFVLERVMLGVQEYSGRWGHEVLRAGLNTAVAIPLFFVLDRLRTDETGL
ncbi:rod shape-determining protein MreD [Terriglobus aquaticus]|uniref:Rod shape-determining protein MreD n=1 Tax=Terriglobus aquaticus TaxID=940139 RepID=A0ABW9KKQ0_9BACT|nr:rod shape-determining protein MreD [Terriglobus aquaticus]